MYALLSPTSGAGTVTVSITGAGQKMAAGAVSFINVSQTIPTASTASGNNTAPTITVSTGAIKSAADQSAPCLMLVAGSDTSITENRGSDNLARAGSAMVD